MMSKPLEIVDRKVFNSHSKDELKKNLFTLNTTWNDNYLSKLGLKIRPMNATEIKIEAIDFVTRYNNKRLEGHKTSNNLGLKSTMGCNVILSDFTYSNLNTILKQASYE